MTHAHCEPIKLRLHVEGFNIEALERSGRLICADAEELLGRFVMDGRIDEDVFKSVIITFLFLEPFSPRRDAECALPDRPASILNVRTAIQNP